MDQWDKWAAIGRRIARAQGDLREAQRKATMARDDVADARKRLELAVKAASLAMTEEGTNGR